MYAGVVVKGNGAMSTAAITSMVLGSTWSSSTSFSKCNNNSNSNNATIS